MIIIYIYTHCLIYNITHTHIYIHIYIWIEINGGKIISADSSQLKLLFFFLCRATKIGHEKPAQSWLRWWNSTSRNRECCFVLSENLENPVYGHWKSHDKAENLGYPQRIDFEPQEFHLKHRWHRWFLRCWRCEVREVSVIRSQATGSLSSRSPAESHRWNKEARSSCFELMSTVILSADYWILGGAVSQGGGSSQSYRIYIMFRYIPTCGRYISPWSYPC